MKARVQSVRYDGRDVSVVVAELSVEPSNRWSLTALVDDPSALMDAPDDPPELVMVTADGRTYRGPAIVTEATITSAPSVARWDGAGDLTEG